MSNKNNIKPIIMDGISINNNNAKVGYWLLGCAGMVYGIVVVGGLTRLTKSGLSMNTLKP